MFTINRFVNINARVYYNMVRGRQLQLLDSQLGLTCVARNYAIKNQTYGNLYTDP